MSMAARLPTIAYVEDDPRARKAFREDIAIYLDNHVDYLARAEDLLERLRPEHPEHMKPGIILIDIDLQGGMSGYQLVDTIRRHHQYLDMTPLIIVTGGYNDTAKITAKAVGADHLLGKPVTWFGFQDAIKNIHFKMGIFDARPVAEESKITVE
jgi:CheY-like chemotaxis protein